MKPIHRLREGEDHVSGASFRKNAERMKAMGTPMKRFQQIEIFPLNIELVSSPQFH